ncbi:hypothetical protein PAECIP111891_04623 [Paenibacillus allorhizoplanae]|uniref:ADP-ribosylglycohydrolase family protein n=1 Tax=Paenibacillus allorhizoplanae TaxID=2905648 RepID=A0ABN8GWG2_9BACL|nr:hypothetical protein PAECIP111891_04623 [Paenibacillus allorhizoplanae]
MIAHSPNEDEPNELEQIHMLRPIGPRKIEREMSSEQWLDKFNGAWLGRAIAQDIHKAVEIAQGTNDQLTLVKRVWDAFSHYDPVHTNNNAAMVAASLAFAQGDFTKAIATSV